MSRLIDADALKEYLSERYMNELYPDWDQLPLDVRQKIGLLGSTFKQAILNAPTIDAEPVVHSSWRDSWPYRTGATCRKCETHAARKHKYCPECGAKMDGGAK